MLHTLAHLLEEVNKNMTAHASDLAREQLTRTCRCLLGTWIAGCGGLGLSSVFQKLVCKLEIILYPLPA